jgi:hypothetical protein
MTFRYSHLPLAHDLDAVQRLNRTTATATATEAPSERRLTADGANVVDFPREKMAAGWIERPT